MEKRYVTPEFAGFWSLENKYQSWLRVEYEVYCTQVAHRIIPDDHIEYIRENFPKLLQEIDVSAILELERKTHHDVVAFLQWLEIKTEGKSRHFHYGMTSSDLVDTSLACQLVQILDTIELRINSICYLLLERAKEGQWFVMMGRSHGMLAQPTTVSNFFTGHLSEFIRARDCLKAAKQDIRYGKLSGPVGSYLNADRGVEAEVMKMLGLLVEPASTQVIPRDRHLSVIVAIARCAAAIERFCTNIRHLHRSEVSEIKEGFVDGQKGSSSMPHKENPIICENLCGLARYIRGLVIPAFENITLWHERDISHSSVERLIFPEATSYITYMLDGMNKLVQNLVIHPVNMEARVEGNRSWMSESMMLMLVNQGLERDAAHSIVSKIIHGPWRESLKECGITAEGIEGIQSYARIFEHSDAIRERVSKLI